MTDIVKALLVRDGQILMAKRADTRRAYPGRWSFPGGHVEAGETLHNALLREVREEIGVEVTLSAFLRDMADGDVTFHLYVVHGWHGVPANLGEEHSSVKWLDFKVAGQLPDLAFDVYRQIFAALADQTSA
ncbi:NUDIX domain-containing protein [Actibacterium sp. 188UL27-1]|uniref:NUDIX domain-containing protein n=1 Tax=Actibacterium sp. 188UL27-1 TaxID=2786961 RepID=UPI0019561DC2|nr:NUDIX domain-containing protein [Actibacterium sp. 188UL27-1]